MFRYTTYSNVLQFIHTINVDNPYLYKSFSNVDSSLLEYQNQYTDKNVYKSPQEIDIRKIYTNSLYKNYKYFCLNREDDISIYPSEIVRSIVMFQNQTGEFGSRGVK